MAGTNYAASVERLRTLALIESKVGILTASLRNERYEAVREALAENVSVSKIAWALGIKRQTADELVKRVRNG